MFERAQRIADAVLLEGYVLYPYRQSSTKNRYRWTFGVLAPRSWSEAGGGDPWWLEAQCLVEGSPRLVGRLRFLQICDRRVEVRTPDGFAPVDRLVEEGVAHVPWQEGELREIDFAAPIEAGVREVPFACDGERETEPLAEGRVVRRRRPLVGSIHIRSERDGALWRLSIRVENHAEVALDLPREEAMIAACASTHLLLAVEDGAFVSLLDPPDAHRSAAERCKSVGTYPVLIGDEGGRDRLLCAPMIMYDHPQIAPESPGDLFDATEIDELLVLRTMTLTADEKRLARATDARAAAILDRVEGIDPDAMARLHGAIRDRPHGYAPGSRVRLRPGPRRTDAQDLLFAGRIARVEKIVQDVDGRDHLAVTIEGDPAADFHRWYGRFHYYGVDEVEPVEEGA